MTRGERNQQELRETAVETRDGVHDSHQADGASEAIGELQSSSVDLRSRP